jgi:hypothetical protein
MRLVPTFTVSGIVTAPAGVSAGSLAVHLLSEDTAASPLFDVATAVTDSAGAFAFYGVPAGQYVARLVRTPAPGEGWRFGQCGGTDAIQYVCTIAEGPVSGQPAVPTEPLLHADADVNVTDSHVSGISLELARGATVRGRIEFEGAAPRPTPTEWRAMNVFLDPAGGQLFQSAGTPTEQQMPGRFDDNGQFVTPSTWPGRYVVRLTGQPSAWAVRRATVQGRDVLDTPFDLKGDADVVITLSDRIRQLSGTVQRDGDQSNLNVTVLLFPSDPDGWIDYGRSTRRLRAVPVGGSAYSMAAPPEGDYLLIALPDQQVNEWRNPAFLKRAAGLADRITVTGGPSVSHPLRVRSIE